ncbi:MAG TPA: T9SS type A sorting domain-containing protein [Luteibaculaceae bacterium]|nr:T9SS type A sorting domain-containing protein [Luteibaculaceae bacterium]
MNRLITLTLLLIFGSAEGVYAQFPYFQKSYDIEGQVTSSTAILVDTNIYMSCGSFKPSSLHLFHGKIDGVGNLLDSLITPDSIRVMGKYIDGMVAYKNHLYSLGSTFINQKRASLLYKLNLDLDTVFVKTYGSLGTSISLQTPRILNDTIHTATFRDGSGNLTYYQLDTNGNVLNTFLVIIPPSYGAVIYDAQLTDDQAIIFSGGYLDSPTADYYKAFFAKVRFTGQTKFVIHPASEAFGSVSLLADKEQYILTHGITVSEELVGFINKELPFVAKYSKDGTLLWRRDYFREDTAITSGAFNQSVCESNGDLVYAGDGKVSSDSSNRSAIIIAKTDSLGNLLWQRHYTWGFNNYLKSLIKSPFGGYYLFGYADIDPNTGHQSPFLWHVDEYGCVSPDCHLADGIAERGSLLPLRIYPNPATSSFVIQCGDCPPDQQMYVQLVDAQGKTLVQQSYRPGDAINTTNLAQGVYSVLLMSKDKQWMGRVVVE